VTEPEGLILPACAAGGCWGGGKKRARRTENPRGGKFSAPRLAAKPPTSEGHRTLCAAQPLSGFPQFSFPAHKRAISRTPHTKLPFCTVEVFARPAHVWADKRVFNLFLQAGGGKFSAPSLVL